MTLLCASIMVHDADQALRDAHEADDHGADLVEFRVDEFFPGEQGDAETKALVALLARSPLPCIVTCRPASEGGAYDGSDAARIALFERLANTKPGPAVRVDGRDLPEHPPTYIDVEHATLARSANIRQKIGLAIRHEGQRRDLATGLILSTHDHAGRPADLTRRVAAMAGVPEATAIKVAYRARSIRDCLELLDLPAHLGHPTIALGMGEFGLLSRVLAPKFGGLLTFASLRPADATAPGQPTIRELLDLYRFRVIGASTSVYGVVGYPLEHSLSPLVHNAGFDAAGHDAVYLPLPIPGAPDPDDAYLSLKATLLELIAHPRLGFRGASITYPHKEGALRLARERGWSIDPACAAIGAANTLVRDGDSWSVLNTDAPALARAMERRAIDLEGASVLILGAGGMARAAACACASAGARVGVLARRPDRAARLAADLAPSCPRGVIRATEGDGAVRGRWRVVINATPVGMRAGPDPGGMPIDLARLGLAPGATVVDAVYNPIDTPFLRGARTLGASTIDGATIFAEQAALQFEAWTERAAPRSLFDRLVRDAAGSSGAAP